ncbi:hypothetical protein DXG01_010926 [Tephrocybe rancida]|nr:hypothetical protein DXG01_010926 [Tephrocybe rancida]
MQRASSSVSITSFTTSIGTKSYWSAEDMTHRGYWIPSNAYVESKHACVQIVDFTWQLLDRPELSGKLRSTLIVATQRLSNASQLYPTCYELKNVVQDGQLPCSAGGSADIFKGTFEKQVVSLKSIRIYQNTQIEHFLKQLSKETILWGTLMHPNILPLYGIYWFNSRICFVSPWMEAGDLSKYLKSHPEASRIHLAFDVAKGLLYLHQNEIIHGDLKGVRHPRFYVSLSLAKYQQANILIDSHGRARLADFGLSSVSDPKILAWTANSSAASKGGTSRWQAPELFDISDKLVKNSTASDVYAWSLVCFEVRLESLCEPRRGTQSPKIFTGIMPFDSFSNEAAVTNYVMQGGRPERPHRSSSAWSRGLNSNIWSLMEACWQKRPAHRPNMARVTEQLWPEVPPEQRPSETRPRDVHRSPSGGMQEQEFETLFDGLDLGSKDLTPESFEIRTKKPLAKQAASSWLQRRSKDGPLVVTNLSEFPPESGGLGDRITSSDYDTYPRRAVSERVGPYTSHDVSEPALWAGLGGPLPRDTPLPPLHNGHVSAYREADLGSQYRSNGGHDRDRRMTEDAMHMAQPSMHFSRQASDGHHGMSVQTPRPPPVYEPVRKSTFSISFTRRGAKVILYAQALHPYSARTPDQLDLWEGDIIAVTHTSDSGWWSGELVDEDRRDAQHGRGHLFPATDITSWKRTMLAASSIYEHPGFSDSDIWTDKHPQSLNPGPAPSKLQTKKVVCTVLGLTAIASTAAYLKFGLGADARCVH